VCLSLVVTGGISERWNEMMKTGGWFANILKKILINFDWDTADCLYGDVLSDFHASGSSPVAYICRYKIWGSGSVRSSY